MVTVTKALELVYQFTPEQCTEFALANNITNDHPNPFVVIEELLTLEQRLKAYQQYNWYFCVMCDYYSIYHCESLKYGKLCCPKCDGRMV